MLKKLLSLLLILFVLTILVVSPANAKEKMEPMKAAELQMTLRDLWVGHIFWVRSVVFATFYGDTAAAKVAEENVVSNAREIAAQAAREIGCITVFYAPSHLDEK